VQTKLAIAIALLPLGLGLAWGCSGSATDSRSAGPVPEDRFIGELVAAICDNVAACCTANGFEYDADGCRRTLSSLYGQAFPAPGAPGVVYDASVAGECIALAARIAESCAEPTGRTNACTSAYVGMRKAGEACTLDLECAAPPGGTADCATDSTTGAQTCQSRPRGKSGDACHATCTERSNGRSCSLHSDRDGSAECYTNDGLFCESTTQACTALGAIGASCTGFDECVSAAFCDSGICVARIALGESCVEHCATGTCSYDDPCVAGAYCEGGSCVPRKSAGAPCSVDTECAGECSGTDPDSRCVAVDSVASELVCGTAEFPPP
jgi:hypothetical protein